jgi:hypothetical protein
LLAPSSPLTGIHHGISSDERSTPAQGRPMPAQGSRRSPVAASAATGGAGAHAWRLEQGRRQHGGAQSRGRWRAEREAGCGCAGMVVRRRCSEEEPPAARGPGGDGGAKSRGGGGAQSCGSGGAQSCGSGGARTRGRRRRAKLWLVAARRARSAAARRAEPEVVVNAEPAATHNTGKKGEIKNKIERM